MVVLALLLGAVTIRLVDLQIANPARYRALSADQRMVERELPAERGAIVDRSGVALAVSVPQRSVFVDPSLVVDPAVTAASIAPVLGVDAAAVEDRIRAGGRFAWLARQVPDELADRVAELGLPGIALTTEPKRFLPTGDVGRGVVGLTDIDGRGISGVEAMFGDVLTGTPGSLTIERGPDGRTIPVGERDVVEAVPGRDVVLSIDRSLQYEAERLLAAQVDATGAKGGVAIVSSPATGEIYAMANVRRDTQTDTVVSDVNNAALTTAYEPGSVMKMITASAAVDLGLVDYSTEFEITDTLKLGDFEFAEHTPRGTVNWALPQILSQSSNIGTIRVAQAVGAQRLYEYLTSFGLGSLTAVGFPNETAGFVHEPGIWNESDIGSVPIGQAISVSPLQMLMAFNVIANGGVYVPPRLVMGTVDADGVRTDLETPASRRVVSEDTADMVNMMLRGVVAVGTGKRAAVAGYPVAGKTGTAAKPQANGTYEDDQGRSFYQATFVGFVPAGDPSLSILVMIDEPAGEDIYGGTVAAPVFADIATAAIRLMHVAPPVVDRAARYAAALPPEAQALTDTLVGRGPEVEVAARGGTRVRASAVAGPPSTTTTVVANEQAAARPSPPGSGR